MVKNKTKTKIGNIIVTEYNISTTEANIWDSVLSSPFLELLQYSREFKLEILTSI